jgi:hypothetical protein
MTADIRITINLDLRIDIPLAESLDGVTNKLLERWTTALEEDLNTGAFDDLVTEPLALEVQAYMRAGDLDDMLEDASHTFNDEDDIEPTFGKEGDDD